MKPEPIEYFLDSDRLRDGFPWQETYQGLLEKLTERIAFSLARYTDGEWYAIWKYPGANVDGHAYFSEMGDALANVLKSRPSYYLGVQWLGMKLVGQRIVQWLHDRDLYLKWLPGEILHEASKAGELGRFVTSLEGRDVILVGKQQLAALPFEHQLIEIPEQNAWREHVAILGNLESLIDKTGSRHPVILYSASMGAEVFIDEVAREFYPVTQIDVGSVWDPYLGMRTRKYHSGMNVTLEDLLR